MSSYEDNLIILLRKIVALAIPKSFEATEDTYRLILMEKLKFQRKDLFLVCEDFIMAYESRDFILKDTLLKLNAQEIWLSQRNMFEKVLEDRKLSLLKECKKHHININYELNKILKDGNINE